MATYSPTLETIEDFLTQKRIAMVGISREPKSFSATLFEELTKRGYDVVPVNPKTPSVLGHPCFARIQDVQPPVTAALIMTSPSATDSVVRDCAEAGVQRVWLHRATGQGSVTPTAVAFCRDHGIQFVAGECPFMFLPAAGAIHRFHGFVRRITGHYPHRHCA